MAEWVEDEGEGTVLLLNLLPSYSSRLLEKRQGDVYPVVLQLTPTVSSDAIVLRSIVSGAPLLSVQMALWEATSPSSEPTDRPAKRDTNDTLSSTC